MQDTSKMKTYLSDWSIHIVDATFHKFSRNIAVFIHFSKNQHYHRDTRSVFETLFLIAAYSSEKPILSSPLNNQTTRRASVNHHFLGLISVVNSVYTIRYRSYVILMYPYVIHLPYCSIISKLFAQKQAKSERQNTASLFN